jgi:hypothetical protein
MVQWEYWRVLIVINALSIMMDMGDAVRPSTHAGL